jgi:hypothetical protein
MPGLDGAWSTCQRKVIGDFDSDALVELFGLV